MKQKILITGGAGFIGSHLVEEYADQHNTEVYVIDDFSTGLYSNLPTNKTNLKIFKGKVQDQEFLLNIFENNQFDFIFHEAAISSVQLSVENPLSTFEVNAKSTLLLLQLSKRQKKLKRFIFASSAAVYGNDPCIPKHESSPIQPLTPYAIDKFCSERYVINYYRLYGIPTTCLRYFNVYGPRQNPDSPYSGVISIFMNQFQYTSKPKLKIFGDGQQTRDFVYVKDVVRANLLVANNEKAIGKVFNVGSGRSSSLLEMVSILENLSSSKAEISFEPSRPGDIKHSSADIRELEASGYVPAYDLKSGLSTYWNMTEAYKQMTDRTIPVTQEL